jgi:hypothetical protein
MSVVLIVLDSDQSNLHCPSHMDKTTTQSIFLALSCDRLKLRRFSTSTCHWRRLGFFFLLVGFFLAILILVLFLLFFLFFLFRRPLLLFLLLFLLYLFLFFFLLLALFPASIEKSSHGYSFNRLIRYNADLCNSMRSRN